jgi:predicted lysophospholipase L1 biosynthesis ABC-type transport system permease subunit
MDAVGRHVGNGPTLREIAGVVNDAKYRSLREPVPPVLYSLYTGNSGDPFVLCVRTRMQPGAVIQPVRDALAALDPALPFIEVHTRAEEVDASAASERLTARLASLFGLVAAILAALGIYGLLSFGIAQRRREIGIRMAVGASSGVIGRMIGTQACVMIAAGVGIGLVAAWQTAPILGSLLYGVAPVDRLSFVAAGVLVALVAAVATIIPGWRAARLDPACALRDDIL